MRNIKVVQSSSSVNTDEGSFADNDNNPRIDVNVTSHSLTITGCRNNEATQAENTSRSTTNTPPITSTNGTTMTLVATKFHIQSRDGSVGGSCGWGTSNKLFNNKAKITCSNRIQRISTSKDAGDDRPAKRRSTINEIMVVLVSTGYVPVVLSLMSIVLLSASVCIMIIYLQSLAPLSKAQIIDTHGGIYYTDNWTVSIYT